MKRKIIQCILLFILFFNFSNIVLAKYTIKKSMIVAKIQVDRTAPNLEVNYSTNEIAPEKVEVTIKANEEIQELDGWILDQERKTLTREYNIDTQEELQIKDLSGNVSTITITIVIQNNEKILEE